RQSPTAGRDVALGTTVMLTFSTDTPPALAKVPDVVGLSLAESYRALTGVGLKLSASGSGTKASKQSHEPGSMVKTGTIVLVRFSGLPVPVRSTVPDLVG